LVLVLWLLSRAARFVALRHHDVAKWARGHRSLLRTVDALSAGLSLRPSLDFDIADRARLARVAVCVRIGGNNRLHFGLCGYTAAVIVFVASRIKQITPFSVSIQRGTTL
jgi:hypothetical protein